MQRILKFLIVACLSSLVNPAFAANKSLEPGVDYVEIPNGTPWQPLNGQIEVVEVFSYSCSHCAAFQPAFAAWKAGAPKNVRVTYLPAAYKADDPSALAYFAGLRTGIIGRAHDRLYKSIHDKGDFPINASVEEYAAYLSAFGPDRNALVALMRSNVVQSDVQRAKKFQTTVDIGGTPTLVVNGRYRILGQSRNDQFRIVNQLIRKLSTTTPR